MSTVSIREVTPHTGILCCLRVVFIYRPLRLIEAAIQTMGQVQLLE